MSDYTNSTNWARGILDQLDKLIPSETSESRRTQLTNLRVSMLAFLTGHGIKDRPALQQEIDAVLGTQSPAPQPVPPITPPAPQPASPTVPTPTPPPAPQPTPPTAPPASPTTPPAGNTPSPAGFAPLKARVDTGFTHLGLDEDGNPMTGGWYDKVNNLGATVVGADGQSGLVGRVNAIEEHLGRQCDDDGTVTFTNVNTVNNDSSSDPNYFIGGVVMGVIFVISIFVFFFAEGMRTAPTLVVGGVFALIAGIAAAFLASRFRRHNNGS